jgi:hypothetical protein
MSHRNQRILAVLSVGIGVAACSSSNPDSPQSTRVGSSAATGGSKASTQSGSALGGGTSKGGDATMGGSASSQPSATSSGGSPGSSVTTQSSGGAKTNVGGSTSLSGTGKGGTGATNTGSTTGGKALGGAAAGGKASGGAASTSKTTGGTTTGGWAAGGAAAGGKATGGMTTGGKAAGGMTTGGMVGGGAATGGGAAGGTTVEGTAGDGGCTPPAVGSKGTNPLFTDVYTADPAALVHNCTFYINCGHDEGSGSGFVMNDWFILKSTDMVKWTRIDKALSLSNFKWSDGNAWAGQMITKGGKFYWFVPVDKAGTCPNNCGMAIGVAVGDSPEGPFKDYLNKPLIDDTLEMSNWNYSVDSDTPYTIDPTVFVDDGGQVYYMYGGFGRLVGGKLTLDGNGVSLDGKIQDISGATGFFEAAYLTKNNGKYYLIYAAGSNPASIDYATSSSPLGPYTYGGRIIDPLPTTSTDAATSHPGVAQFAGQWYLVYHVSNGPNGGGTYHREVALEKMTFNANGTIQKITPSSGLTF